MNFEEALKIADAAVFAKTNRHLRDVEIIVLRGAWEGQKYHQIAEASRYTPEYLMQDVGSKLWKLLSVALGEEVSKTDFKAAFERRSRLQSQTAAQPIAPAISSGVTTNSVRLDWGEAPDVSIFFGRDAELNKLDRWILRDRCRLVALLGMGGIGKTALAAKLGAAIQGEFECLIWRSLRYAPRLPAILTELNAFTSSSPETQLPTTLGEQISFLLKSLRDRRCLLILDDWEAILRSGDIAGYYREGYEEYGQLLQRIGEQPHQSCLLLLSREKPVEVASLAGETLPVRAFPVKGLQPTDAKNIFFVKGFSGSENGLDELIQLYRGNPAALKITATIIQELFNGNISQFIDQSSLVIGDIFANLLHQHFQRLSDLEKDAMYWLAIEQQPISLSQLKTKLSAGVSRSDFLKILESLARRSLIEKETYSSGESKFALEPVMMKYVIQRFIQAICENLLVAMQSQSTDKLGLIGSHDLSQEPEIEDDRITQPNLILTKVRERLDLRGTKSDRMQLQALLSKVRDSPSPKLQYAEKNLLKVLGEAEI
ncbi:MAG: NB-ARC domain-containing protein [Oscillatoriaceae cyanobacterium Prado104]|jgi:predicted transcriptional regulator|nr:NB-ARC domain-containing protein [Oscillatoriaceae cyanobacterium Prado104]